MKEEVKIIELKKDVKIAIEYHEEINGYDVVIVLHGLGHRCGYVGVKSNHALYGIDYYDERVSNLDVHGGITYSNHNSIVDKSDNKYWYFGFDCAHGEDKPDFEALKDYGMVTMGTMYMMNQPMYDDCTVRTFEYVKEQCLGLLEQLKALD